MREYGNILDDEKYGIVAVLSPSFMRKVEKNSESIIIKVSIHYYEYYDGHTDKSYISYLYVQGAGWLKVIPSTVNCLIPCHVWSVFTFFSHFQL